jgi:radical SAM protein (TIGR01212 family)
VSSISGDSTGAQIDWREAGLRYHRLSHFLRTKFGRPVYKVSVDAGLGCPHARGDGSGGCTFCNVHSYSPSRRMEARSILDQIDQGTRRLRRRFRAERFIAYFQPGTNTYGPVEQLREVWEKALHHPSVVGLAVGTRPDCVSDEVLDLMAELSQRTWLTVEFGVQTVHDRSLDWLRRGHRHEASVHAIRQSRRRGLRVGAHVILGLPGESRDDVLATARELARLRVDSVKLHNLHVAKDTALARMFAAGEVTLPDCRAYVDLVVGFLEQLPPECVIDRLVGDAPAEYLVAPAWCRDKGSVRSAIEGELARRGTWQGRKHSTPASCE